MRDVKFSFWDWVNIYWHRYVVRPKDFLIAKFIRRHNVLKARSLPSTWVDKDEQMLHFCFQLLVDFIEKERAFEVIDTSDPLEGKFDYDELLSLYHW